MENVLLIDWLSITSKELSVADFKRVLGMDTVPWIVTHGARGYQDREYFNGISIHYNGREDMGVWMEMSGQGCRAFEDLGSGDFTRLFQLVTSGHGSITRLDVAYDDHAGVLDIQQLASDTMSGMYVSKSKTWKVEVGSCGTTIYHGSMASDILIRIYDKAAERHCAPSEHWIRVELQLRRDRALQFISMPQEPGVVFSGVLANYLRYVVPDETDGNRWRWPLTDYWLALIQDAAPISLFVKPGLEYNIDRCENFVYRQAGGAIDALIQIYGVEMFQQNLKERKSPFQNPKYTQLINQYGG